MNLGRFRDIVDAYGAAPEAWPEKERQAALALTRSSLPAARLLAAARNLDHVLTRPPADSPAFDPLRFAQLQSRILAAAGERRADWIMRWLGVDLSPAQLWPPIAGLAFATALGFAVGVAGLLQLDSDRDADETTGWATADSAFSGP